jgi:ferritin
MISEKMVNSLNDQINSELYSAYLYLAMRAYFESQNLLGFANWMNVQTQEEMVHVMKFYDFINSRNGRVELGAIEKPPVEWASPMEVFEAVYKHEQFVTDRINKLVELAQGLKDHATESFLKWFVDEQVEEEASDVAVIQKLKLMQNAPGGMFMLDNELAQRVFTPPPAAPPQ